MAEVAHQVQQWVRGWSTARSMAYQAVPGGWRIAVNGPARDVEYVTVDPDPDELARLAAEAAAEPSGWLTVVGTRPAAVPDTRLVVLADAEAIMVCHLAATAIPSEVDLQVDPGATATATIELDGVTAASGRTAVVDTIAVFDQILTDPRFRRRGLGRQVMAALTGWAVGRGGTTGLLVASVEGQHLYAAIGWRTLAPIITYGRALPSPTDRRSPVTG